MSLALEKFIPVFLLSVGLFALMRMAGRVSREIGRMAFLGWLLATVGLVGQALWQLALTVVDGRWTLPWLTGALPLVSGSGFVFVAWALWLAQRRLQRYKMPSLPYAVPFVTILLLLAVVGSVAFTSASTELWFGWVLALTALANFAMVGLLVRFSWRVHLPVAATLFAINLLVVVAMVATGRINLRTVQAQWIEQAIYTIAQGAFALAALKLRDHTLAIMIQRPQVRLAPIS
jgi:hypothetical protein